MKLKLSRDTWLALGLLLALIVVTALSVIQQTRAEAVSPSYLSTSTEPNGLQALSEWLEALDYAVAEHTTAAFSIPDDAQVLILVEPRFPVSEADLEQVDDWVEQGGTLLLVGWQIFARQVLNHYDVNLDAMPADEQRLVPTAPLMTGPMVRQPLPLAARFHLRPDRDDSVTLLAANGRSLAITFPQGAGRVIATTLRDPFTNAGLQQEGSAAYILNLFSLTGKAATEVWFDDWHHGVRASGVDSSNWLQQTPGGRAILLLGAILFVTVALRGRRFGRPVPLPADLSRRAPMEHITAIANLNRRAGHRTAVLQDYHDRLKRHLGFRYRLNPALPDDEFVAALAAYNP